MKKISPLLTQNFFILNSHPALLPKYGGKGMYGENVHKAVIENNESQSGVTLHRIDEEYDKGAIILQKKLTLSSEENVQSLQKKIKELEKSATIEALKICLK
jgi:phosphoribosylglycinamide formyltransferase-1